MRHAAGEVLPESAASRTARRSGSAASAATGSTTPAQAANRPRPVGPRVGAGCAGQRARAGSARSAARDAGAGRATLPRHGAAPRQRPVRRPRRLHGTFADGSDPEQVRELLSRYFDLAREVVERYGGTIEKFIGDAVMAVWGTPDRARGRRRARRPRGARARRRRAAAGSRGRRRRRSSAGRRPDRRGRGDDRRHEPGHGRGRPRQHRVAAPVRRAARARCSSARRPSAPRTGAIAVRAGRRAGLKGKAAPVPAWRALRVVAERGGRNRTETASRRRSSAATTSCACSRTLFHATARERGAAPRLGHRPGRHRQEPARLGVREVHRRARSRPIYWHQGRSPAYGEGITLLGARRDGPRGARTWPRATTRRRPARGSPRRSPSTSRTRPSGAGSSPRCWPCSASAPPAGGREELFAAWRTFFERIAATAPDGARVRGPPLGRPGCSTSSTTCSTGRSDFPILVVTLARPELLERRPGWGAGRRNFIARLARAAARAGDARAARGPGARAARRRRRGRSSRGPTGSRCTRSRRSGCCVADGRLELADGAYRPVGDLADARGPGDPARARSRRASTRSTTPTGRLLQDASVLGQTLHARRRSPRSAGVGRDGRSSLGCATSPGASCSTLDTRPAVAGARPVRLRPGADPRGRLRHAREAAIAGRGTSPRRATSRRSATTSWPAPSRRTTSPPTKRSPTGPEADAVAAQARIALRAPPSAPPASARTIRPWRYLRQALTVTTDPAELRTSWSGPATSASAARPPRRGRRRSSGRRSTSQRQRGDRSAAARATAALGRSMLLRPTRRRRQSARCSSRPPPSSPTWRTIPNVVALNGQLARAAYYVEDFERAQAIAERVLAAAERLDLLPIIADTLVTRGMGHALSGRAYEGAGALEAALQAGRGSRVSSATIIRARINLGGRSGGEIPRVALAASQPGLELARRFGRRSEGIILAGNAAHGRAPTRRVGLGRGRSGRRAGRRTSSEPWIGRSSTRPLVSDPRLPGRGHRREMLEGLETHARRRHRPAERADLRRAQAAVARGHGDLQRAYVLSMEAASFSWVNGPARSRSPGGRRPGGDRSLRIAGARAARGDRPARTGPGIGTNRRCEHRWPRWRAGGPRRPTCSVTRSAAGATWLPVRPGAHGDGRRVAARRRRPGRARGHRRRPGDPLSALRRRRLFVDWTRRWPRTRSVRHPDHCGRRVGQRRRRGHVVDRRLKPTPDRADSPRSTPSPRPGSRIASSAPRRPARPRKPPRSRGSSSARSSARSSSGAARTTTCSCSCRPAAGSTGRSCGHTSA